MRSERELGANRVIIGRAVPNGEDKNGSRASPFSRQLPGIRSRRAIKSLRGLFGAERVLDHLGRRCRRQGGWGSGLRRLTVPDGQVDETSTIPHQFAHLKQIGNLPGAACPAQPSRPPEPARRRNVARTCDGERRLRSGFARLAVMRTPLRGAPWLCPRPASMRACFLFLGCEKPSGAEGVPRVRHSETRDRDARASRLEPNVTPGRCSLLTRLVPPS